MQHLLEIVNYTCATSSLYFIIDILMAAKFKTLPQYLDIFGHNLPQFPVRILSFCCMHISFLKKTIMETLLILQFPPELQSVHNVLQHSQHFLRGDGNHLIKRGSRASDTSSAYSGSDMMQSSLGDDEHVHMSGLAEALVDSDDEEGYVESPDVSTFTIPRKTSASWSFYMYSG